MPKKGTLKHDFHRIVQALERRNEFHPLAEKFLGWIDAFSSFYPWCASSKENPAILAENNCSHSELEWAC